MTLEIRDPVIAAVAERVAREVPGVARLAGSSPLRGARLRQRGRGVEVNRAGAARSVALRLVVAGDPPVIEVVRTVQRSVHDELARLTGLDVEVTVVVVDLA